MAGPGPARPIWPESVRRIKLRNETGLTNRPNSYVLNVMVCSFSRGSPMTFSTPAASRALRWGIALALGLSLAYATSSSAKGPWKYQGIIMEPLPSTTTIHPAMFDFNGQTYLAYHSADLPGGGNYRRSVSLDRVYFNKDGTIKPIVRTSKK